MDNQITYPIAKSERRKWGQAQIVDAHMHVFFTKEIFSYLRVPTVAFHHFWLQSPLLESRAAKRKKNNFQTYNIMNVHNRP
jgi:hypothetical protein